VTNSIPIPPPHEPPIVDDGKGGTRLNDVWYRYLDSNSLSKTGAKTLLTEDSTYVVVSATGSDDTGNGTLAKPFATPQGCYDYLLANVDANGFFVKIRMNDSSATTYTATANKRRRTDEFSTDTTVLTIAANIQNCPCVEFEAGGIAGPDYSTNRVKWDGNGGTNIYIAAVDGLYRFQGIAFVDSAVSKGDTIFSNNSCTFSVNECDFGDAGTYQIHIGPGSIFKSANYSISGDATFHIFAEQGSSVDALTGTVTLVGTPAFGSAFALFAAGSSYTLLGITFSGAATGTTHNVQNSTIGHDNGADLDDYLPGDGDGTSYYDFSNGYGRVLSQRKSDIATGADVIAFTGGTTGILVTATNLNSGASGLFFISSGNTVTKITGDASFEASATPAGGNSGFMWDGASNYKIYNNTGLTRSYSVLVNFSVLS
jgi:hypothetical protein